MADYIKLLICDVDGCLTDGRKHYADNGKAVAKAFADVDFTAIKRLKQGGVAVCWLSADRFINEAVAKERGIDFWYAKSEDGQIHKAEFLKILCNHYNVKVDQLIYIGDDAYDLELAIAIKDSKPSGLVAAPRNAIAEMKEIADIPVCRGGHGAIADLYQQLRLLGRLKNIVTEVRE